MSEQRSGVEQLKAALQIIRDEDWDALGLTKQQQDSIRLGQGAADYHVLDAMRITARRALEVLEHDEAEASK